MQSFKKNLIFTADDFGYNSAFNLAIYKAYDKGMLNSCALIANCEGFSEAVEIFKNMKDCHLGIHLNIIEGNSLLNNKPFNDWFLKIWQKTYDKNYMNFLEKEFRIQIEKILSYHKADMINSHVHTHAIPKIFELVCNLAQEYEIEYIRTQFEKPYYIKGKVLKPSYPINIIKLTLLNSLTLINRNILKRYNLKTNDYLIGVNYTGDMDVNTVKNGLAAIQNNAQTAEILVHPCYYDNISDLLSIQKQHYKEFQIFFDKDLKNEIEKQGWKLEK